MKPALTSPLLLAAALLSAAICAAEDRKADLTALSAQFTNSLVIVEYELQFDKSDAPTGGIGAERCPSCGQFHGNDLTKYLREERPVESPGYLVAPDRVVTKDPQLHARFIKSISVRLHEQKIPATVLSHPLRERGMVLALAAPLTGGAPLKFETSSGSPVATVDLNWQLGRWCVMAAPYMESILTPPGEPASRYTHVPGVVLSANGVPMGLILDGWIPLGDAWQGSPLLWPAENADALGKRMEATRENAAAHILRVHLGFRSAKAKPMDYENYRPRYSHSDDTDFNEDTTEADVPGVVLPAGKILVLANLDPKITARLERIELHTADGKSHAGKFVATLKDFGALVVATDMPGAGAMKIAQTDVVAFRERLLLRADISLQGENRDEHFQSARIAAFNYGPKQKLYPQLDGPTPPEAFLFTPEQELIALSLEPREQISGGRQSYNSQDTELVPASYVLAAVNALPASADPSNVPVSEADENRLAWLGAELQPLNQELARANGVASQTRDGETGALVSYVHPDSPAAAAGIKAGNVLLRLKVPDRPLPVEVQIEEDPMRGQAFPWDRLDEVPPQFFERIPSPWPPVENNFIRALTDLGFGTRYTVEFFADGKVQKKELQVVAGPAHFESAPRFQSEALGITVRDLTYEVRRYLQRKNDEPGVVVSKVEPGGRAGVAGVRPYELITHVNDQPVATVKAFEALTAVGGELKLSIKRMAKGRIVTVKTASK